MRKVLFFALLFVSAVSFSQAPQLLNYQGIARNSAGTIITSPIGIKFEILQGSASGTLVFDETNNITPSSAGIFTTAIGAGSPGVGSIGGINWANGPYFIRLSIDPAGGTSYSTVGTSQLLSVPYALYAETAGNAQTFTAGNGITINSGTITNSAPNQTVNISGSGVTGSYPNYTVSSGATPTAGNGISIISGTITNTAPDQTVTISGATGTYPNFTVTSTPPTTITPGNSNISVTGADPNFTISSIPTLSLSGAQLSISNGNTVTLPTGTTYTNGAGIGLTSGTIITNTAPNQTVTVSSGTNVTVNGTYPNYTINATPTLSLSTNVLSITGGNAVVLPSSPATTVSAGLNMIVSGTSPTYTVTTPNYSLNFSSSSTGTLTNGMSTTSVSIPQPTLTVSGTNSNVISAGSNSITIPHYTAGNGLALSGTAPNFTLGATSTGTSAGWSTLGNTGTNAGANFLGTTDAQDLVFRTQNSQRIRIFNPTGFVGIGNVVTATELLQVETGGSLTAVSILSGTNASLYFGNAGNHQRGRIVYDNTSDLMSFGTNGSTGQMGITSTGKVGIGTTGPSELLQLQSSTNTDLSLLSPGGSLASLAFGFTGNHFMGRIQYDITNNTMNFWTNNTPNRIFIDGSGKIGMGTTTPVSELDVNGSLRLNGSRLFLGAVGGVNSGYTGIYETSSDLKLAVLATGAPANLPFASANSIDAITIKNNTGYVGIGIGTPTQLLHVHNGSALFETNPGQNSILLDQSSVITNDLTGGTPRFVNALNGIWRWGAGITLTTDNNYHIYNYNAVRNDFTILDANGNIGLGTGAPASKLHVAGAVTIVDGSQGDGKILVSNTSGTSSWKKGSSYSYFYPTASGMSNVSSTAVMVTGMSYAYNKLEAGTTLEIDYIGHMSASGVPGGAGVVLEIKVDGNPCASFSGRAVYWSTDSPNYTNIVAKGIVENLSAGVHSIQIWVSSSSGITTSVFVNPGNWTDQIIVKETH
ncbi:MAG: hypothetical protein KA163_13005 [Bacteroidia bacterium]|nr:hypothetical protein [Bacteroidia bacterium]